MSPGDPKPTPGVRPTEIGAFSAPAGETNRTRTIPVPWIDCDACAWRHFPSTTKGRWHIATTCSNCGAGLTFPAGVADPAPAVPAEDEGSP